jgi:YggT family protein
MSSRTHLSAMNVLASYAVFVGAVRATLFFVAVIAAVVCAVDWAVRTRRLNPFSRTARFFRGRVDPLISPVERVVVRAGGPPSTAPWWALIAVIVGAIVLITLLDFFGDIVYQAVVMVQQPGEAPRILLSWVFSLLRIALLVRVLSSWFPIPPSSRWIRWSYVLTEWMIAPLRRVVPLIGMIDITPLVAWFLLSLIQRAFGIP